LIPPFKFSLFRRDRLRKSGRPSLFEPSLKVQRDFAHNPPSGFEVQPPMLWCQRPRSSKGPSHTSRRHGESASVARALEVIGLYCGAPDQTRTSGLPRVLRGRSIDPAAPRAAESEAILLGVPLGFAPVEKSAGRLTKPAPQLPSCFPEAFCWEADQPENRCK